MDINIGVVVNTHGIKGELKVKSFSDFNDIRFKKGNYITLSGKGESLVAEIASYKEHKGMVIISLKDYQDINLVEKYKGYKIFIDSKERHTLEENEVYYSDLAGCEVYDEENNLLGVVEDILETGANAVLRVNKKILIPFVKEFIVDIDVNSKKIIIHVVEGLL